MERRRATITSRPPWLEDLVHRLAEHGLGRAVRSPKSGGRDPSVLAAIRRTLDARGGTVTPRAEARPTLTAAVRRASEIRVDVDPAGPLLRLGPSRILTVEVADGRVTVSVYDARAGRKSAGQGFVKGRLEREIAVAPSALGTIDPSRLHGMVIVVDTAADAVVDWYLPVWSYTPVPASVLQDGLGLRALVLAHDGGASLPLAPGSYRLTLTIARRRFEALDPWAPLSVYARTASLLVEV